MHRAALAEDSGGAGTFRGGLGGIYEYELLEGEATVTYRGERHFCAAAGTADGVSGAPAAAVIQRADGSPDVVVPSKIVSGLHAGDRILVTTAGGGGHGSPAQRDPALVLRDVADGKVGAKTAREVYGRNTTTFPNADA